MAYGFVMKIPKSAYQKALARGAGRRGSKASNRDRAVVEMYRYQQRKKAGPIFGYLKGHKVTNWTGLKLCTVTRRSSGRTGFPDISGRRPERVHVTARCWDGRMYVGSGPGDGMYVRLRPKRGKR